MQSTLFPDDTLHKTFLNLYRDQTLAGQYALDRTQTTATLDAPREATTQVILTFIREGVRHIFIGPDHILFVLALVLLGGRPRTQVKIITAFTAAHSVTLALATLNVVQLPDRLVESVIALSIVVVGLHDLRALHNPNRTARDPRTALAFAFGLIHGFGFASVLREQALPGRCRVVPGRIQHRRGGRSAVHPARHGRHPDPPAPDWTPRHPRQACASPPPPSPRQAAYGSCNAC